MDLCRRSFVALAMAGAFLSPAAAARAQAGPASEDGPAGDERLRERVAKLRAEKHLIGLAAMIMVDGKVVAAAADGERKKGSEVAVEVGDRWHLGSITKSMTATMIARLVERRELQWTTTVGECFGESFEMHAQCRGITLAQLLTHTSGAPPNFPVLTQFRRPPEGEKRVKARRSAVAAVLRNEPRSRPGESYKYSNVGFTIAAAMAEEQTGRSWEDLIRREVFLPLSLGRAGFGPPQDGDKPLEQPRGHQKLGPFKRAVGQDEDNSPIMAPAGAVHMTLADLCAYGNEHLLGERGKGRLLKAETYKQLHTPRLKNYALGWVVPERSRWTGGRLIWHNGSNTLWYALLAVLPDRNAVISVASNDGDIEAAEAAAFKIVKEFSQGQ